mmetsp:Transcript_19763/g.59966  ORF Transcript_19763/g.59966 Transcript_19763/m.59966 type:complete len:98 (+) Transcript_19763:260-553(+)
MSLRLTFSLALALTAITTQKLNETLEGNASSASWFLTLGYWGVRVTQRSGGIDHIAHALLQLLGLGEASLRLTRPDTLSTVLLSINCYGEHTSLMIR